MASDTGTAGGYTYAFVVDAWRIQDPDDNRIATCYDEANARAIVFALNSAVMPVVTDVLDTLEANARELRELSTERVSSRGAGNALDLNRIRISLEPCVRLRDAASARTPTEMRREGALASVRADRVRTDAFSARWVESVQGRRAHWLITSATGERVATAFTERHRDIILDALNDERVEFRRDGALDSDPYARGGFSFADLVEYSAQEVTFHDAATGVMRSVRDRVLEDVRAAHRMLDAAGVAGGPLTARIGLALMPRIVANAAGIAEVARHAETIDAARAFSFPSPRGAMPARDVDDVRIPEPDAVLAMLDKLNGEELFRLFDAVKVLPPSTAEARNWNLMDADEVRRMTVECLSIALENGRLGELAKAAREALARKVKA